MCLHRAHGRHQIAHGRAKRELIANSSTSLAAPVQVPASVRVRRQDNAVGRKPKAVVLVPEKKAPTVEKPKSMDESYSAFLEEMKELGAFEER